MKHQDESHDAVSRRFHQLAFLWPIGEILELIRAEKLK